METKPVITRLLSESGQVFSPQAVAKDLVAYSSRGYFGISTGLDGWILKQLHPGMSPINSAAEVVQQVLFSGLARIISVFYVLAWDSLVQTELKKAASKTAAAATATTTKSKSQ